MVVVLLIIVAVLLVFGVWYFERMTPPTPVPAQSGAPVAVTFSTITGSSSISSTLYMPSYDNSFTQNQDFTPTTPSFIPSGYVLSPGGPKWNDLAQYSILPLSSSSIAFDVTEGQLISSTTTPSPIFPSSRPDSVSFFNLGDGSGYITRYNRYSWSTLVFSGNYMEIEIDAYVPISNDDLVKMLQSIPLIPGSNH